VTYDQEGGTRNLFIHSFINTKNLHQLLECVSCILAQFFSCTYKFIAQNRTQRYSVPETGMHCTWPKSCCLIGRLCFRPASCIAIIVSHVCCANLHGEETCVSFWFQIL